jgi:hypothetical protein
MKLSFALSALLATTASANVLRGVAADRALAVFRNSDGSTGTEISWCEAGGQRISPCSAVNGEYYNGNLVTGSGSSSSWQSGSHSSGGSDTTVVSGGLRVKVSAALTPTQVLSADRLISKGCGETINNRCTPVEKSQVSAARRFRKEISQKIDQLKQKGCGFDKPPGCTKEENLAVQQETTRKKRRDEETTTTCAGGKTKFVELRHGQKIGKLDISNNVVCSSGDVEVNDVTTQFGSRLISFGSGEFGNGEDFCNNCCRCRKVWAKQCFFNKVGSDFDKQKCLDA